MSNKALTSLFLILLILWVCLAAIVAIMDYHMRLQDGHAEIQDKLAVDMANQALTHTKVVFIEADTISTIKKELVCALKICSKLDAKVSLLEVWQRAQPLWRPTSQWYFPNFDTNGLPITNVLVNPPGMILLNSTVGGRVH